jgi:hypothetical protein
MNLSGMTDEDRMGKLITLIKGRAFAWLAIQPTWNQMDYQELIVLLRKEYGGIKTRELARLEALKCGPDIYKFNEDFNRIGQ